MTRADLGRPGLIRGDRGRQSQTGADKSSKGADRARQGLTEPDRG